MFRDPIIYIFCLIFPILLIVVFQIIDSNMVGTRNTMFSAKTLMPGMMMFSSSFVMLLIALLLSKDRSTAFLKRLYISPLKTSDYMLGYMVPGLAIGLLQFILCLLFCWAFGLFFNKEFFGFDKCLLLILAMVPILLTNIFLGIIFGSLLNDKSAPGLSSIIISLSGLLGGAWMPLDTMKEFEIACLCFPFYPSVYLGRIITNAEHTIPPMQSSDIVQYYSFDNLGQASLIIVFIYLIGLGLVAHFILQRSQKEK